MSYNKMGSQPPGVDHLRHYELVVLLHPESNVLAARFVKDIEETVKGSGGTVHRVEDWGIRPLAYMINMLARAHYICLNIECSREALAEVENKFRFSDAVLRHLAVSTRNAPSGKSPMMKSVEMEGRRKRSSGMKFEEQEDLEEDSELDVSVLNRIAVTTATLDVELTVDRDFDEFSEDDARRLVREIRAALRTSTDVEVLNIAPGSVKLTLRLSQEAAEELYWAAIHGELSHLKIESARILSRAAIDAILKRKKEEGKFDVFLCHNSADKSEVMTIARKLQEYGIRPWLDEWEMRPGEEWLPALEAQIESVLSAAVFIGSGGIGPWQNREMQALLREFVRRGAPVIPVVLKSCQDDSEKIPIFLNGMHKVCMKKRKPNPYQQLFWGITGKRTNLIT